MRPAGVIQTPPLDCWRLNFLLLLPIGLIVITKGAPLLIAESMEFVETGAEVLVPDETAAMGAELDVDPTDCEDCEDGGDREGSDIDEDCGELATELAIEFANELAVGPPIELATELATALEGVVVRLHM